jgi:hypothetical protein
MLAVSATALVAVLLFIVGGLKAPCCDPLFTNFQGTAEVSGTPIAMQKGLEFKVEALVKGTGIPEDAVTIGACTKKLECTPKSVTALEDAEVKTVVDCLNAAVRGCSISFA